MSYASKYFDLDYLKKVNIQEIGVYYTIPIKNIKEDKRNEFDYEDLEDYITLDSETINDSDYIEDYSNIEYDYTDTWEIEDFLGNLMNTKKYEHYLVLLDYATWCNSSGVKIFNDYKECFYRNYDSSMYYEDSSKKGKILTLREYHHDKPTGHNTYIIGLTETEYNKLENKSIEYLIDYARKYIGV